MGVFKGPAGLYGCLEAFLPTMGVFSVVPDPFPHGCLLRGRKVERNRQ